MNTTAIELTEKDSCGTTKAAYLLQVSVGTVHQMVEKGELESWRTVGGHRRILMKSIRETQARRRIHSMEEGRRQSGLNVVVLTATVDNMVDIKTCLSSIKSQRLGVTYYENPTVMMLNLPSLMPHVLLLDMESLDALGGKDWLNQIRRHDGYAQTRLLLLCDKLGADDTAAVLMNKVEVLRKPFNESWLNGYVHALIASWELTASPV